MTLQEIFNQTKNAEQETKKQNQPVDIRKIALTFAEKMHKIDFLGQSEKTAKRQAIQRRVLEILAEYNQVMEPILNEMASFDEQNYVRAKFKLGFPGCLLLKNNGTRKRLQKMNKRLVKLREVFVQKSKSIKSSYNLWNNISQLAFETTSLIMGCIISSNNGEQTGVEENELKMKEYAKMGMIPKDQQGEDLLEYAKQKGV